LPFFPSAFKANHRFGHRNPVRLQVKNSDNPLSWSDRRAGQGHVNVWVSIPSLSHFGLRERIVQINADEIVSLPVAQQSQI
jgi:hypothetical protein